MTAIRFTSGTALPMYGRAVDVLHLDIDGAQYAVRVVDGEPVIQPAPVTADTAPVYDEWTSGGTLQRQLRRPS